MPKSNIKIVAKSPKLRKSGAWSFKLKIWCHWQILNMKFGGSSQNGKKLPKIPDFGKNYGGGA